MPDGLAGGGGSGPDGAGVPGHLSMLLQELARAPGDDLHRAWQQRLQPGDTVGRFEILREIGRGGFGVVYEALDRQLGRSVAFKTLRPARTGHELSTDWILKEAEAVARLDHPAIVTLHDVGRCASGPYLVEELLHGETLEQRLRGGPLLARDAVAIGLEVARGLAHAHVRGVLHQDLKPGNVFLTEDGRVKLLDFGLAHLLGTRGVYGAGTPAYMAPEQLRGEAVDARSDVFALGATLFEALAGKAPFEVKEGRSGALDEGPLPALPEGVPDPLAALAERCLSKDPAKRPASGQAVVEELLAAERALERAGPEGSGAPVGIPARTSARLALMLAGVAVVVAVGVYLVATRGRSATETLGLSTASPALPSIAVLPFADMSPGKDQEYFADGIAEEILNALAQVEGLRVPGRTSSFWFKGKNARLADIGRELNVTHVLEGSVRRAGKRLRVTAQLVSVADGFHLWSETFDRDQADVFEVQDQVANAVVDALRVKLLPGAEQPASPSRTGSMEAYEEYLLGGQLLSRYTVDDVRRATYSLEKAVTLDPSLAPAWARLSLALWWIAALDLATPAGAENKRRAIAAAERAVALAPRLAEGYAARSRVRNDFQWDFAGADEDEARALAIAPNSPLVLSVSCANLRSRGRLTKSAAACRRAIELDPLIVGARNQLSFTYLAGGELAQARVLNARVFEISPGSRAAQTVRCQLDFFEGKRAEARQHCGRLPDEDDRLLMVALMAQEWGTPAEADRALRALIDASGARAPGSVAAAYAWRGDADRAFEWLERAYQRHSGLVEVKADPLLRKVREDRRFAALLRKLKLPVD